MASFSYSDDQDQRRAAQQDKLGAPQPVGGPSPTFGELQRMGRPRPPSPAMSALYGAAGQEPPPPMPQMGRMNDVMRGGGGGGAQPPPPPGPPPARGGHPPYVGSTAFTGHGTGVPDLTQKSGGIAPYVPTNELNQSNLEGYLYDTLANPTKTAAYKNIMKKVGAEVDTDASRRGVYYSTIPVGAYEQAGTDLASQMQQQAFGNLRNYNQDYEQLFMALLGAT